MRKLLQIVIGSSCVCIISLAIGCGVSKEYVGANAQTIRTNATTTSKTLEVALAKCGSEDCVLKKGALSAMNEDIKQICERAEAMCDVSAPHCNGAQPK